MHTNNIKQAKYVVFMYLGVCAFSFCVYVCEYLKIILKKENKNLEENKKFIIHGHVFKKKGKK